MTAIKPLLDRVGARGWGKNMDDRKSRNAQERKETRPHPVRGTGAVINLFTVVIRNWLYVFINKNVFLCSLMVGYHGISG